MVEIMLRNRTEGDIFSRDPQYVIMIEDRDTAKIMAVYTPLDVITSHYLTRVSRGVNQGEIVPIDILHDEVLGIMDLGDIPGDRLSAETFKRTYNEAKIFATRIASRRHFSGGFRLIDEVVDPFQDISISQ